MDQTDAHSESLCKLCSVVEGRVLVPVVEVVESDELSFRVPDSLLLGVGGGHGGWEVL